MPYSQALRPLAVDTTLGPDALLLTAIAGVEEMSRPFEFTLDLQSENPGVDVDALVGKPACVTIDPPTGGTRYIHGLVRRVREVGQGTVLASYQAELVPWLWMLSLSTDCRIFQQLSVPEIVTQLFGDLGYADYELRLVRTYPKREYCVQYRETHLNFVSRLLEDEGIAYHFVHTADKHTLVLSDSAAGARPCPGPATLSPVRAAAVLAPWTGDTYTTLTVDRALHTRAVALADYDYLHPTVSLEVSSAGDDGLGEAFDYPGGYVAMAEGDRYARLRLELADAQRETAEGVSGAAALTSGYRMAFAGDGPGAGGRKWLVTRVAHEARQGGYVAASSANGANGSEDGFTYSNRFTLASADLPWRPPPRTPRPRVQGTQSALVVGKSGEEIWTDSHGRVKLHFYWDRRGKRDENSSCWVRCSTAWAGRGYGQFSVPRMGQEVLVDFLEGDPDRPVVVGRVYNADQPPPCDPGGSRGVVSGLRTKTHKGAGYNGIEMNDTAGKEHFAVHAQYDMETTVEHDDTQTVVSGNRKIDVKAGTHTETIKGDTTITIATGAYKLAVQANTHTHTVKGNVIEEYAADQNTTVSGNQTTKVTHEVMIDGGDQITLKSGSSSITLKKDGTITIQGKTIEMTGTTEIAGSAPDVEFAGTKSVTIGVSSQAVSCDPAKVTISGTAINASASAIHEISGGLVKIN